MERHVGALSKRQEFRPATPDRRGGRRSGAAAAARCPRRRTASRRRLPWSACGRACRGCRGPRRSGAGPRRRARRSHTAAATACARAGRCRGAPEALEACERDAASVVVLLGAALQLDVTGDREDPGARAVGREGSDSRDVTVPRRRRRVMPALLDDARQAGAGHGPADVDERVRGPQIDRDVMHAERRPQPPPGHTATVISSDTHPNSVSDDPGRARAIRCVRAREDAHPIRGAV